MADAPKSRRLLVERGSTGLRRTGGYVSADFLPQLIGQDGYTRYTEMASNDPLISGLLFAITMLIRGLPWRMEPAKLEEKEKGKEGKAKEYADFCGPALFERMEISLPDVMSEIATMFPYGYAPLEIVFRKDDDGQVSIERLSLRGQDTINRWEFDPDGNGQILGLWQMDPYSGDPDRWNVFIPIEKLMLFRTDTVRNNPEGRSILRGAYVPWVRKRAIEEAEGRTALRAAGIVQLKIPSELMDATADANQKAIYNAYIAIAAKLAEDRQGAIVLPSDVHPDTKHPLYEMSFVTADSKRSADMNAILERYDKRIAGVALADFMLLGQQAVGSFALSADKTAMFLKVLEAWSMLIAGVFNRQLMPRWMELNGWDPELAPRLTPGQLQEPDLIQIATFLATLAKAGMPLFPDEPLAEHLRKLARLPEPSPEAMDAHQQSHDVETEMKDLQLEGQKQALKDQKAGLAPGGKRPALPPGKK